MGFPAISVLKPEPRCLEIPYANLVVEIDENGVAAFKRIQVPGEALAGNEHLLRFRKRGNGIRIGAESFFFQEGHAEYYSNAKYGELRVTEAGESVLVGLRGAELERLGEVGRG